MSKIGLLFQDKARNLSEWEKNYIMRLAVQKINGYC